MGSRNFLVSAEERTLQVSDYFLTLLPVLTFRSLSAPVPVNINLGSMNPVLNANTPAPNTRNRTISWRRRRASVTPSLATIME